MKKKILRRESPTTEHNFDKNLPPILQKIYAQRGIQSPIQLERELKHLLPFSDLKGMDAAVQCLSAAIIQHEKILIVGDFDADGATSCAVAMRALRSFGVREVDYLVPNRFTLGYGLTPELVALTKEFSPALIITVDNGIANHDGVIAAKALGIKVVITDHHLPAATLPPADAIVNPNQFDDEFKSKCIAGVGVIFYVMLALRRHLLTINWFQQTNIPEPNMAELLDLVALGTVADVVALDHNNRILVHQGLRRIRAGKCVPGISALLAVAGRTSTKLAASDLGFAVAPRLNAAGRLEDMSYGIECLLTDDLEQANKMATVLNQLNDERRLIEQEMQTQAMQILAKFNYAENKKQLPSGICLFDKTWHQGVIGIVASRIKDRFHRPVIAFAANGDELKGSARSIPGLHIRDVLAHVVTLHPGLILKFGGHAMAAGLTLARNSFDQFATVFDQVVSQYLTEDMLHHYLLSDGELTTEELSLVLAEMIHDAGPWGQGFPEPMFDGVFEVLEQRIVGSKHLKMVLRHNNQLINAIAFNIDIEVWPNHRCRHVHIAYRLAINEFRERRDVQLIVEHLVDAAGIAHEA